MTPTLTANAATALPTPTPGQVVRVRQRQYLVEEVVPAASAIDVPLVRLACLDDDAQGQPLEVLWGLEPDAEILTSAGWNHLAGRGFDPPKLFSAYLHTLRWNCVTATNPRLFQAPFRAGIKIDAYQVEPLQKALKLPRVNLFIADDVGLGKTIEAGLIARELLLRKKVRDIVVACPPSVLPQWQDELETRFGLTFQVLDREYVLNTRRERGYATNPWATHTRFLISHRLLTDEHYTAPLRDWLGDFRPGSLLILDEAHHAAPAAASRYAIDSKITRAVRDLARRFEHRLFLSATPHNGHSNSFSALLEILDPQRFCRGVPVKGKKLLEDVMVRRLIEDIRSIQGGFPRRDPVQIDITGLPTDAPELRLSALLDRYRTYWETQLKDATSGKQTVAMLLVSGLQQRLLSSIEAFARTLKVHRRTIERRQATDASGTKPAVTPSLLDMLATPPGSDDERAVLTPEQLERDEDAQFEAATTSALGSAGGEGLALLNEMSRIAEENRCRPDARVRKLVEWVKANLLVDGIRWNDRRVLIFTEYEDTLRYLREQLESAVGNTDRAEERLSVYRGSTSAADRKAVKAAFNTDPHKHPLRILLCTDAAREGINLQTHCADLFHFDVPWNPSRMEQRNGRIDRKLQPSPVVRCHHFVYTQRPEDRVIQAIVRKTETIKKQLGSLAQVVEGRLSDSISKGIRHADVDGLVGDIDRADLDADYKEVVTEELEEARERQDDLRSQIEGLRTRLKESKDWVGLDDAHFRAAISCGLELLGSPPLTEASTGRFVFPAVDQRHGGDSSWADTLDGLREPRQADQKFWEWREKAGLRPVVFEAPDTMTDEVVQLHLEHRIVQRLLGRFTSQGFVYNDLSRACLAQSTDPIPRVALVGRLCLYGEGAARLHEELIHVTARWIDPKNRKGKPLTPFGREAEGNTLQLLHDSLLKATQPTSELILQNLLASASADVADLLPELEKRGRQLGDSAEKRLADRGAKEAKDMRQILEDQKERIAATTEKNRAPTLFDMVEEERRQLEADKRHWSRRLEQIEQELVGDPERIEAVYRVKARRVEPVGLVYLWPVTG
jgi:superfamily II DNA or RNA helicase